MVTHGSVGVLVRHLREQGLDAQSFNTEYGDDEEEPQSAEPESAEVLP
jgi:putative mRNA 3-end processing factor